MDKSLFSAKIKRLHAVQVLGKPCMSGEVFLDKKKQNFFSIVAHNPRLWISIDLSTAVYAIRYRSCSFLVRIVADLVISPVSRRLHMDIRTLVRHPIIQGPMAGGANSPALVAAVSNAGALGSLAASLLSAEQLREELARIRLLSDQPFLVNLFVQATPQPTPDQINAAEELLKPVYAALHLDALPLPARWCEDLQAQLEVLLEMRPAVVSFTFDILPASQVQHLHDADILVVGTATTVAEALAWQEAGADAVIASGIEAGGHRGTFLGPQIEARLGLWQLLPDVVAAVDIPVIAAGAIMDGSDIHHALQLGAMAVQMGTAFLVTEESGIHPAYKQRLLTAGSHPTRLTRGITGRYARGLENRLMELVQDVQAAVPAYPVQNALTSGIRAAAARMNQTEFMSLWAGMGVSRARGMGAAQLVQTLITEMQAAVASRR